MALFKRKGEKTKEWKRKYEEEIRNSAYQQSLYEKKLEQMKWECGTCHKLVKGSRYANPAKGIME